MTNGEMIQKVFNCEVCEPIMEDDIIHVIFSDKNDSAIGFDWSWWNMEYKEPKTGHCKDCKWWKDSDGKYRRGCGAESQCPINTHTVYCGEGYCYMFVPQDSEVDEGI